MKASRYCIAFGCLNNDKDRNLSFFTLPKYIERRRKWLSLIDREDIIQKDETLKNYLVCSAHFDNSSFKIIRHLKENALPSLHLHNQTQEDEPHSEAQSTSTQVETKVNILSNDIIKEGSLQSTSAQVKGKGTGKGTGKIILLSKNEELVSVGNQTESLKSSEEQTQTSKSLTEGTPRKRKLVNRVRECKLKRRKLQRE